MGRLDLNATLVLVRVAQAGSFRSAARLLGMPKTSVSRKVAELEEQLGAQLLHRTTRQLSLTDAGLAFLEEAEAALAHLEAAELAVSELQREPRGRLRVTTTVTLGQLFLGPLVAEFLDAHPGVEITLHHTERTVDLVAERYDVAVRAGPLPDSSLVAHLVGSSVYRVVAAPRYLARRQIPTKPTDLSAHECLRFAKTGSAPRTTWSFGRAGRRSEVAVAGRFVADDFSVLREAAVRGLGIAWLPSPVVREAIREKRLVSLLEGYAPPATPIHVLHLGGRHLPPRTRAFIDFVRPRLSQALAEGAQE
jgi:DNA-binding transcriptional LysR family regulator